MANSLIKKLNGYQKADRSRFKLLREGVLTIEELMLFELAIAITDWDSEHEHFGSFKVADEDIANILGWKDRSSVCRYRNNLIKKGFLTVLEEGYIRPKDFEKWELRKSGIKEISKEEIRIQGLLDDIQQLELKKAEITHDVDVAKQQQEFSAEMQLSVEEKQHQDAEVQQNHASDPNYSLSSFKGVFNNGNSKELSNEDKNGNNDQEAISTESISVEEIDRIIKDIDTKLDIQNLKDKYSHLQKNSSTEPPKNYPPLDEKLSSAEIDSIIESIEIASKEKLNNQSTGEIVSLKGFFDE